MNKLLSKLIQKCSSLYSRKILNLMTKSSLAAFFIVVANGCVQVSESQWAEFCSNTYWEQHGLDDGQNGRSYKLIAVYKDRCGEQFSKNDIKQYKKGYIKGIREFCTYDNGFTFGYGNQSNPKACTFELAKDFNRGFREGRSRFFIEKSIRENAVRETEEEERWSNSAGPEIP